jgi:two-component system nitrogen regulation sensor histidine kinase GlnL
MHGNYGFLHPLFAAYIIGCFACGVNLLYRKYRVATELSKLQLQYLFFAFAASAALASITNLIVPLFFRTSVLSPYGPFFSVLLLGLIGHAIIRHRLMDIRVVVKRGAVYASALVTSAGIFVGLLLASNVLLPPEHDFSLREIVLALAVAVSFHPVKAWIQRLFDRYLYRDPYDFRQIIREASHALGGTIDLSALTAHVGHVVNETMRPEHIAIYVLDAEEPEYRLAWGSGASGMPGSLPAPSPLLRLTPPEGRLIFRDELAPNPPTPEAAAALGELERLGAEVVVLLIEEGETLGLLVIGPKRSGDPYFSDDADLLTTLANQSALAIRNAQTHARVVQVNEEIQKILATIDSGVVAVGAKGRLTLFNRAAERLTGVSAAAARGQSAGALPGPLARLLEATMQDGTPRAQVELSLPDAAGQLVPLVCSTSPLLGPHGQPAGAVAVIGDLSRLKELEQERRRAERLASLEAIASGLVHEVRNPLVALKTFSQFVATKGHDPAFREQFVRVAAREIGRVDELLTRFRTLAAPSSQPMEPIDVLGPLQATLELIRPQLEARQIRLRQVGDGAPRPVLGNASQLEQLFLNLCLNAIDAMQPDGELTVRVADLCEGGGSTLIVEVSDTGRGIPDELLGAIFNPFVTSKPHGTGLGLAICRSIADAHRARLSAKNHVGRPGCTFTIEFPVPVARAAQATT